MQPSACGGASVGWARPGRPRECGGEGEAQRAWGVAGLGGHGQRPRRPDDARPVLAGRPPGSPGDLVPDAAGSYVLRVLSYAS